MFRKTHSKVSSIYFVSLGRTCGECFLSIDWQQVKLSRIATHSLAKHIKMCSSELTDIFIWMHRYLHMNAPKYSCRDSVEELQAEAGDDNLGGLWSGFCFSPSVQSVILTDMLNAMHCLLYSFIQSHYSSWTIALKGRPDGAGANVMLLNIKRSQFWSCEILSKIKFLSHPWCTCRKWKKLPHFHICMPAH